MAAEKKYTVRELARIWRLSPETVRKYLEKPESFPRANPAASAGWLTVADVAGMAGISEKTVRTMEKNGTLPSHRIGGAIRFLPGEVLAATRRGAPAVPHAAP